MSKRNEVTCDGCGADLTYTGNSVDYRLALGSESMTPWYVGEGQTGGAVTNMMIYPPIDGTKHFCRLHCLADWIDASGGVSDA